ncbi:MAG: UTP--glucose-1-phosphate uridylyltransferase, partial [Planctomycetota bacterium]
MADSLPVPDFGIDAHAARVYQRFVAAGQGHVFAFWNRLETDQRANFIQQLEALDLDRVARLAALINQPPASADDDANSTGDTWTAPGVIEPPRTDDERAAWAEAREQGELLLRSGRVAALTVAGGQASRLGHNAPKGCLPFGPVTGCSLFEVFAAQIRAARERYGVQMPWMLMTSPANHDDTVAFFASHEHFGLDPSRIRFFRQATLPALDDNGRLLLEAPDRIFEAPDGHGGVLTAMRRHALLGWLAGLRC